MEVSSNKEISTVKGFMWVDQIDRFDQNTDQPIQSQKNLLEKDLASYPSSIQTSFGHLAKLNDDYQDALRHWPKKVFDTEISEESWVVKILLQEISICIKYKSMKVKMNQLAPQQLWTSIL